MITIVVRTVGTPSGAQVDAVVGTIVVAGDRVLQGDEIVLETVRGRARVAAGDTFEDRLRAAFPYSNGYVTWEIVEAPERGSTSSWHDR